MVDDRKSSTMNSIFAGSTIDKPNVDLIINAVATILHSQMLEVSFHNKRIIGLKLGENNPIR